MGRRRQARELALQSLYLADTGAMAILDALTTVRRGSLIDDVSWEFTQSLAQGTYDARAEIDIRLRKLTKNWSLERMAAVDRNLLRLASYELHCGSETPPSVIIDEAIEIAKVFASNESGGFINGILDKMKSYKGEGA